MSETVVVVHVVVLFCIWVPVIYKVYPDILVSLPAQVKTTSLVVLKTVPLAGKLPVTIGLVLSIVNIIPVVLP
ncbi:MAG: hypothetical protein WCL02_01840 [bacterium]